MEAGTFTPSVALAAYAEQWLGGARVVVFGSALSPLADHLLERGAQAVCVCDGQAARVAEAARHRTSADVTYVHFEGRPQSVRSSAYDVALVENIASWPSPKALLDALGRILARRGIALLASPNADYGQTALFQSPDKSEQEPLAYYDFYDLVGAQFDSVTMLGQTPFVGYALASFGGGEDAEISVDTGALPNGAEAPEWFVALASDSPAASEAFAIVQLPREGMASGRGPNPGRRVARSADRKVAALSAELEARHAEIAALREEMARRGTGAAPAKPRAPDSGELQQLRRAVRERDQWLKELEARASTADERADSVQARLERLEGDSEALRKSLQQAENQTRDLKRQEREAREQARNLELELERGSARSVSEEAERSLRESASELQAQVESLEGRLREESRAAKDAARQVEAAQRRVESARSQAEQAKAQREDERRQAKDAVAAARAEAQQLEQQLQERGAEVRKLEAHLRDAQRVGKHLVLELEGLRDDPASTQARLDLLAERNAELSANLEAAHWTIATLGEPAPGQGSEPNRGAASEPSEA